MTFAGDCSGTATFTNLGNATLSVVVNNDSHTHDTRYFTETEIDYKFDNYVLKSSDMTLTLSGDATGSATFTNMSNASLSVAVKDNSHNHDSQYYTKAQIGNVQDVLDDLELLI